jgi:DNA (cytosine-5)-methyltransferase 1
VADNLEITAVELDTELARMYQERFPNDTVIVADAHQYLLDHYKEFDFIWSSPPCPTHSRARYWNSSNYDTTTPGVFPDMKLYEEILFLQHYFKGKYVVENVIPYYQPLIDAKKKGRHLFWTNFNLPNIISERKLKIVEKGAEMPKLKSFHKYDFDKYKGKQFIYKIARNLVDYEAGKTILETALGIIKKQDIKQTELF